MNYLSLSFQNGNNSYNELIKVPSNEKISNYVHKTNIKEINNLDGYHFYGYQCKNCLYNIWKDNRTEDENLVKSFFCSNDCKYSYQFTNKKKNPENYSKKSYYKYSISLSSPSLSLSPISFQ